MNHAYIYSLIFCSSAGDTDGVGRCLVEAARSTGSEDNITAVVVFLRPVATLMEEEGQRIAQGQVPESIPAVLMEKDSTPSSINAIFSPPAFSPPINQFEISENSINKGFTSEDVDTVFGFNNHHDENQDGGVVAPVDEKEHVEGKDEPMEGSEAPIMPPHDSDSDEGLAVGAESTPITQDFNPHDAPTPTAEEVDAALAELDSIPDGVCEAGDVEEEEEDEEEWSYYRMEPQTQPQSDDILQGGASTTTTVPDLAHTEDVEVLPMPSDMVHDQDIIPVPKDQTEDIIQEQVLDHFEETNRDVEGNLSKEIPLQNELVDFDEKCPSPMETDLALVNPKSLSPSDTDVDLLTDITQSDIEKVIIEPSSPQGSGSPHVPGSPRSVEGFVTSVELNTPEETFGTNFAINQSQDPFSGVVDQTSGPFSVYVSSSPEPASLDPPGLAPVDLLNMNGGMSNGEEHALNAQASQPCDESPVEIVHAQSTVEVVAPPSPVDVSGPETQFILDSPPVPPADITFVPMPATEPSAEEPIPVYVDDTPVSEPDVIPEVETVPESTLEIQRETSETVFQVESASHMESTIDTNLELSQIPASSVPEASPDELVPVTPVLDTSLLGKPEVTPEQVPDLIISTPGGTDNVGALVTDIPEATNEVAEAAPVIVEAPVAAAKAESKVTKTKAKPTADKASPKTTLGKATPSRASSGKPTPTRSTPSKTPVTKTPTSRTPTAKITEKKTLAAKTTTQSTSRPSSVKATINKSATSTAEKVETSKQPRVKSTVTKAPLNTAPKPSSTTRASFARTPGTTASKTTTTTSAGAPKPARRIPATGTTTTARRPLSSSTSADKTDSSKLVNGSSLRPSQTATAARTTATTAARKPLASTKPPARPAAEKATKNTTNQMLSTRTTKSASPAGKTTTRTTAAHSTSRTTGKLNETTSSVKSRVTSASKASASKTTSAATKKTLVSKTSKTTALATKKSPAKTKTDDAVIESGEPVVNGENKIANEESSVEVIEKCAVEDNMQASAEKVISETVSSEQLIVSSETTEILVNGDH
ncbi:hypothetical protein SK128_004006 [Halocaridina rubra]|uniref:Uncharacterized protein n=1 Tax=Halocaridina rubra TaxID=373956 RepID=A0AAN8X2U2_HALRR